jgi:hypothetical protein
MMTAREASRRLRERFARQQDRRDFREGFPFEGRWITPDEAHATCKARMDQIDRLPREVRDRINEKGRP